METRGLK